jgi:hypothetical protein
VSSAEKVTLIKNDSALSLINNLAEADLAAAENSGQGTGDHLKSQLVSAVSGYDKLDSHSPASQIDQLTLDSADELPGTARLVKLGIPSIPSFTEILNNTR